MFFCSVCWPEFLSIDPEDEFPVFDGIKDNSFFLELNMAGKPGIMFS